MKNILIILVLFFVSCSGGNKKNSTERNVKDDRVDIDHFLIFKFDSSLNEVIDSLKSNKIAFKKPVTLNKNGLNYQHLQVLNYPLVDKTLNPVDLYFWNDSLYLIKHEKSFREEDVDAEAQQCNHSFDNIFSGLYEKYGKPTHSRNYNYRSNQTIEENQRSVDTTSDIGRESWIDWQYLDPKERNVENISYSYLEVQWVSKSASITIRKGYSISYKPYKEKIDRSKRPDFLPPLAKEYIDGKTYTFHHTILESNFMVYAFSPKIDEFNKKQKQFEEQKQLESDKKNERETKMKKKQLRDAL